MKKNAWRFGFVMSYPASASPDITCYRYESWHYRYVGREEAAAIHDAGTTIRQYLWSELGNDVMAGPSKRQPATPAPAASSSPTRPPTPRPTASAISTTRPRPAPSTATQQPTPTTTAEAAAPTPGPTGGVAGTTGGPSGRSGSPLGLLLHALGIMLGIVVGLGILVAAEQLTGRSTAGCAASGWRDGRLRSSIGGGIDRSHCALEASGVEQVGGHGPLALDRHPSRSSNG